MNEGIVYVLINEAFDGYVKIGNRKKWLELSDHLPISYKLSSV